MKKANKPLNIGITGQSTTLIAGSALEVKKMLQDKDVWGEEHTVIDLECNKNLVSREQIQAIIKSTSNSKSRNWWNDDCLKGVKDKCQQNLKAKAINGLIIPGNSTNLFAPLTKPFEKWLDNNKSDATEPNSTYNYLGYSNYKETEYDQETEEEVPREENGKEKFVREAMERTIGEACYITAAGSSNIPVWGICGGHQLIAAMHGNEVGYIQANQQSYDNVDATTINLKSQMYGPLQGRYGDGDYSIGKGTDVIYRHMQGVRSPNFKKDAGWDEKLSGLNLTGVATWQGKERVSSYENAPGEGEGYVMGTQFHPELHYSAGVGENKERWKQKYDNEDDRDVGTRINKGVVQHFLDKASNKTYD